MKFSSDQQERIISQFMEVIYPKLPQLLDQIAALDKMSNDEKLKFVAFQQQLFGDAASAFGLDGMVGKLALGPMVLAAKGWLSLNKEKMRAQLKEALSKQQ